MMHIKLIILFIFIGVNSVNFVKAEVPQEPVEITISLNGIPIRVFQISFKFSSVELQDQCRDNPLFKEQNVLVVNLDNKDIRLDKGNAICNYFKNYSDESTKFTEKKKEEITKNALPQLVEVFNSHLLDCKTFKYGTPVISAAISGLVKIVATKDGCSRINDALTKAGQEFNKKEKNRLAKESKEKNILDEEKRIKAAKELADFYKTPEGQLALKQEKEYLERRKKAEENVSNTKDFTICSCQNNCMDKIKASCSFAVACAVMSEEKYLEFKNTHKFNMELSSKRMCENF